MLQEDNSASRVCQILANIRCGKKISYNVLKNIFKKEIPLVQEYYRYLYCFFEECHPGLIKKFMKEQNITRKEIIDVFNFLPERGEKWNFRKALSNGEF